MQRRNQAGWADATAIRVLHPSGQLVSIATAPGGDRAIDYGDLARIIPQWQTTPVMSQAPLPHINRRRFVSVAVARHWVSDLMTKQHKNTAQALDDLVDWAAVEPMGVSDAA